MTEHIGEKDAPAPAEFGPIQKPYTYLPEYADVDYVDGKLRVARLVLSRATDPEKRLRWMQTVDILLAQRTALVGILPPGVQHDAEDDQ